MNADERRSKTEGFIGVYLRSSATQFVFSGIPATNIIAL
jgi:hypothetical protein